MSPSEEITNSIIELLRGTPLAADERDLSRLVRLPRVTQVDVAVLVKFGEAETVQGALDSMSEREDAHALPLAWRSRFGEVGDT